MQIGKIDSVWRYPVKGMRGEEIPHIYTAYTGLMGDRIYGVVAADGDPGHPWHTGRDQEEFLLYKASYQSSEELLLSAADFGLALAAFTLLVFWKTPPWLVVILTAFGGWALHAGLMS